MAKAFEGLENEGRLPKRRQLPTMAVAAIAKTNATEAAVGDSNR